MSDGGACRQGTCPSACLSDWRGYHLCANSVYCSLEVGAGGGLVGLGVALECNGVQSRLLLTDQVEMLDLMRHNIELNEVQHRAEALILNWCVPPSMAL